MIVLLGASGFVGTAFSRRLHEAGRDVLCVSRRDVNYYEPDQLVEFLRWERPRFLINAAGYTGRPNIDACEVNKDECLAANAVLPGVIRRACQEASIPWGHVSTGCIYTGARPDGGGFREEDPPNFCFRNNNCSFYSGSKALGEEILAGAERCYIWRLRMPFTNQDESRNYLAKLMRYDRLLRATNSLSHLDEFVDAAVACFDKQVPFGTYNLTNSGGVSTEEIVELIQQSGLCPQKQFHYFASEGEFSGAAASAPRANCILDNSKALRAGLPLSSIKEAIWNSLVNWRAPATPCRLD